jgi:hypothetical protein
MGAANRFNAIGNFSRFSSTPMRQERNAPKGFEQFYKQRKNEPQREEEPNKDSNEEPKKKKCNDW